MRYMMIVKGDENFSASGPPPGELIEEIGRLGEAAAKAGKMVRWEASSTAHRASR